MARALAIFAFLFALVAADEVEDALNSDDACLAKGADCGLELLQVKGEASAEEADEDEDEDEAEDEDVAEEDLDSMVAAKRCFTKIDKNAFRKGGAKKFNAALEHCGRSCAAGFPCTKSCMHKAGYSWGCSICAAKLVGCGRDHCVNQCISNSFSPACQHCNKAHCRKSMHACSGRPLGGS